ncbi:MAG: prolyl oligopeptidase family serine peptidase [Gemmatimonadota bacterium]
MLVAGTMLGAQAVAAPATAIQSRTYDFADAGTSMGYELYVPSSYDSTVPTPLIVALHGLGSNPRQVIRYQGLTDLAEERGYIVVAPMGYSTGGWYGSLGHGRIPTRGDSSIGPDNHGALSEEDVLNVLGIVRNEFNVDADRIFLFGHSMGGGGTYHIAMEHPTLFRALGVAAPAIYSSPDSLRIIRALPVIVVQGDSDRLVDVRTTRRWVATMDSLGMTHEYIEIPGGDHSSLIARDPGNIARIFDFFDRVGATPVQK